MALWAKIKSLLDPGLGDPPDAPKLDASSQSALSASLKALPAGERGWITMPEARSLFSAMSDQQAFGELDDQGRSNLAAFAARREQRSSYDFMPVEGRLYFTRRAN
jgi:hypothetical protein